MTAPNEPSLDALIRHPDRSVQELSAQGMSGINGVIGTADTLVWINAKAPTDEQTELLRHEFGLHPLAVEDVRKRGQRPKLDAYSAQHMVVAYEAVEGESRTGAGGRAAQRSWAMWPALEERNPVDGVVSRTCVR